MALSSTTTRIQYNGNGSTTAFVTGFKFLANSHVQVVKRVTATGVETTWVEGTDYTLTGAGAASGTVTASTAPSAGETLTIIRAAPNTQGSSLPLGGAIASTTIEEALDLAAMRDQQLEEKIGRSLLLPVSSDTSDLELPEPEADKVLGWNTGATALENKTVNAAAYLSVSSYIQTLLDDADAAAARSTLGVSTTGLDITGLTALTAPATDDELPIYDLSAAANRKITLADLFKVIAALSAETAPATDDELAIYDTSAGTGDKITLANMLKVLNSLTEDTTPDAAADFVLTYDTSASAVKKVKPTNLGAAGIDTVSVQVFTGDGTWTKPAGVKYVRIVCVGSGGGGGGAKNASGGCGGGGGGGSYAEKILDVQAVSSAAVTVGAAGTGGVASPAGAGVAGGDVSFGTDCIGKGGSGGGVTSPGAGGVAGTGDIKIVGQAGATGVSGSGATYILNGGGGNSGGGFGYGGRPVGTDGAGNPGTGYGGGGGGGLDDDDSGSAGGAGTKGICIVYEFK